MGGGTTRTHSHETRDLPVLLNSPPVQVEPRMLWLEVEMFSDEATAPGRESATRGAARGRESLGFNTSGS